MLAQEHLGIPPLKHTLIYSKIYSKPTRLKYFSLSTFTLRLKLEKKIVIQQTSWFANSCPWSVNLVLAVSNMYHLGYKWPHLSHCLWLLQSPCTGLSLNGSIRSITRTSQDLFICRTCIFWLKHLAQQTTTSTKKTGSTYSALKILTTTLFSSCQMPSPLQNEPLCGACSTLAATERLRGSVPVGTGWYRVMTVTGFEMQR